MIVDKLTGDQRRALLSAMKRMMVADSRVRREELTLYALMREDFGLDMSISASESYGELDLSQFDTEVSQRVLIFCLAVMANADGEFHTTEASLLDNICNHFYVPEEELKELLSLAAEQGLLIQRLIKFFKLQE